MKRTLCAVAAAFLFFGCCSSSQPAAESPQQGLLIGSSVSAPEEVVVEDVFGYDLPGFPGIRAGAVAVPDQRKRGAEDVYTAFFPSGMQVRRGMKVRACRLTVKVTGSRTKMGRVYLVQ